MKLARFSIGDTISIGVVKDDGIVDIGRTEIGAVSDMISIIEGGSDLLARIETATAGASADYRLDQVRLLAPLHPGKYLAIGMNYRKHVEEARAAGVPIPSRQMWFNKQTSCIAGPHDPIEPGVTESLDYEAELGVVIGKAAKGVKAADALSYVFGYLVANDVTARDWQQHSPTFTIGKSFDTHGPIGPWIVTADEISDPQALELRCLVNGLPRQSSSTSEMIYGVADQIEYLSTAFTLNPGDLIATGTPEGVGIAMKPPTFLQPGDVVRCEIDGVGAIENRVAA